MSDCLFCNMIAGKTPCRKVFEDEQVFVIEDIRPQAPTHVLVIPKKHIRGLKEATAGGCRRSSGTRTWWRRRLRASAASRTATARCTTSARVPGQSVFHLHLHLIGGRDMKWPPG